MYSKGAIGLLAKKLQGLKIHLSKREGESEVSGNTKGKPLLVHRGSKNRNLQGFAVCVLSIAEKS